jgi:uncharacterized YccA/Bax inhibitor family protein
VQTVAALIVEAVGVAVVIVVLSVRAVLCNALRVCRTLGVVAVDVTVGVVVLSIGAVLWAVALVGAVGLLTIGQSVTIIVDAISARGYT